MKMQIFGNNISYLKRVYAISKKETFHILRDPFTLGIALFLPVMMVVIFGLCIEFNIKNIPISVFDGDRSTSSRKFLELMGASNYFILHPVSAASEGIRLLDANSTRAALIIESDFENNLLTGKGASIQALLDGSDSSTIGSTISYLNSMSILNASKILGHNLDTNTNTNINNPILVDIKTRYLYNPELNSRWFTIPGLLAMVLSILSVLLTALAVAREWENGPMEFLLSTPVRPLEIIIGKLLPYIVLGLAAIFIIYFTARVFFGVPFRGNHFIFLLGCLLFLATNMALGILISVMTRKQQVAVQISIQLGLLPSMLLSGFIFPIESMPVFLQYLTGIFPARWFTEISRDVFLKGSGLSDLSTPFIALSVATVVVVSLAAVKFKTDLEP